MSCQFCKILELKSPHVSKKVWDQILIENSNFIVVPSKGSIIPGWLLIIPKRHIINFGALTEIEREELKTLLDRIDENYNLTFGKPTIFEHGPGKRFSPVGCGIDHAHLHLIPNLDLLAHAKDLFPEIIWKPIKDISHTTQFFENGLNYLYLNDGDGLPVVTTDSSIPSQFFRRVVASILNIPEQFDYREYPFEKNVIKTLQLFQESKLATEAKILV